MAVRSTATAMCGSTGPRTASFRSIPTTGKSFCCNRQAGVFDSSDGTVNGTPLNSSPSQFFRVSEIAFDPHKRRRLMSRTSRERQGRQ